eukprot:g15200.t1
MKGAQYQEYSEREPAPTVIVPSAGVTTTKSSHPDARNPRQLRMVQPHMFLIGVGEQPGDPAPHIEMRLPVPCLFQCLMGSAMPQIRHSLPSDAILCHPKEYEAILNAIQGEWRIVPEDMPAGRMGQTNRYQRQVAYQNANVSGKGYLTSGGGNSRAGVQKQEFQFSTAASRPGVLFIDAWGSYIDRNSITELRQRAEGGNFPTELGIMNGLGYKLSWKRKQMTTGGGSSGSSGAAGEGGGKSTMEKIKELTEMRGAGLITENEYQEKKQQLLAHM